MPPKAEVQRLVDRIKNSSPFESLEATRQLIELSREMDRRFSNQTRRAPEAIDSLFSILNEALATEIVGVLRYRRHHFIAQELGENALAAELLAYANEDLGHGDELARRIVQLHGSPNFSPHGLATRSQTEYSEGRTLIEMIGDDLICERVAFDFYMQMISDVAESDETVLVLLRIQDDRKKRVAALADVRADLEKDWESRNQTA